MSMWTNPGRTYTNARDRYAPIILQEAEAICRGRPLHNHEGPDLQHLRGLLASESGYNTEAVVYLRRRATLCGSDAAVWIDLGDVQVRLGQYAEAEAAYRRAIGLGTNDFSVTRRLSRVLVCQNRLVEAKAALEEALPLISAPVDIHGDLANLLDQQRLLPEAVIHAECAAALAPSDPAQHVGLGKLRLRGHQWEQALESFRRALQLKPDDVDSRTGSGEALLGLGRFEDAVEELREALVLSPHDVAASKQLVAALELIDRPDEAVSAWCQLGEALQRRDHLQDAAAAYREALLRRPTCLKACWGLAAIHLELAEPTTTVRYANMALALEPEHAPARQLRGWALQHLGELQRAWEDMAYYEMHNFRPRRFFEQPVWDGGRLDGRSILLWADEALGDTIQWVRYAEVAKERGAHQVIVQCDRRLVRLIERNPHVDRVVARRMPVSAFDVHAPLGSLPCILQTQTGNIPNRAPYLSVDSRLVAEWCERLQESEPAVRVGLVWGGDPGRKTAALRYSSLSAFAPLAGIESVRFVSLQQGVPAAELHSPPLGLSIETFSEEARSLSDTAALVMNLHLVITVDTMMAHLVGALGKPVWVLLTHVPDWRWRLEGDTSPWYPTMRLFRQTRRGDWASLLVHVRDALETEVATLVGMLTRH